MSHAFAETAFTPSVRKAQRRGGPHGFLKVLTDRTLAIAVDAGNRQQISMGNLAGNDLVEGFAWRCPQHIPLRIAELEARHAQHAADPPAPG